MEPQAVGTARGPGSQGLPLHPFFFCFLVFFFFVFLGLHPQHMEVPRLEVELKLQLPAYTTATATAMADPSRICDLCYSSRQCCILNPLSEGRDGTHILMDSSRVPNALSQDGHSLCPLLSSGSANCQGWLWL